MNDRQRLAHLIKSTNQRRILIDLVKKNDWKTGAEIGVLKGKTLFSLLDACSSLTMFGIDQWKVLPLRDDQCAETYDVFNMRSIKSVVMARARHYGHRCKIIESDSVEASQSFLDESLNFVFIDGDHTKWGVRRDIEAWAPKVAKGGMILGHDISWHTVREVVDELCPGWKAFGEEVWGVAR